MKVHILDKLRCPICSGTIVLNPFIEENVEEADVPVVKEGVLLCSSCKVWYPIFNYVPVMLIFQTPFHVRFAETHSLQLQSLSEYGMPKGNPKPGEMAVQETFTDEWDHVQDDELSFTYTLDELKSLNRNVWLRSLQKATDEIKIVLNVGCGLGLETVAIQEAIGGSEIFGIDLNFAVLQSGGKYEARPNFHLIVASLFALPFETDVFDLVYSQGVLHHTYSTYEALKSIASYTRSGGQLFIWVYGLDDHLVLRGLIGIVTRTRWHVEGLLRFFTQPPCIMVYAKAGR